MVKHFLSIKIRFHYVKTVDVSFAYESLCSVCIYLLVRPNFLL